MKMLKSVLALLLACVLVLSLAGCHKAGEIAVEVDGVKFTSAMYSYCLLNADTEAKGKVDEAHAAAHAAGEHAAETNGIDYYKEKIDDTDYVTWVENRAIAMLSEYAVVYNLCVQNNVTLDEETMSQIEANADYYYSYYEPMFKANGIGKETYKTMIQYDAYVSEYFDFLYGAEGSRAISADEIKKLYDESYRTIFVIEESISGKTEDEITAVKKEFEDFKTRIASDEEIIKVYNEYYGYTEGSTYASYAAKEVVDCLSAIANPEVDSSRGITFWKEVKALQDNEVVVLESEDEKVIRLVKAMSSENDGKYIELLDSSLRSTLKLEEYQNEIQTTAQNAKVTKNSFAIKQFKVKKISYGE